MREYECIITNTKIINMYDYLTKEFIQEFVSIRIASQVLFKNPQKHGAIDDSLAGKTKKTRLPDGRRVYFKYREE